MRKRIATLLALCMSLSLIACGGQSGQSASTSGSSEAAGAATSAATEQAAAAESTEQAAEETPAEPAGDISGPLVLYSSMTEFDLEALIHCFGEVYPDVEIEVVSGSVGEYTSRITAEASNPQGDVTWGGLMDSDGDTYSEIFEHWVSDYNDEAMAGYSTPNGFYSMDHLSTVCFCVNTELEAELGIEIRSYEDLLQPELKGKIVFSDPNSSSAAWNNLSNIFAIYGVGTDEAWDYIDKLLDNLVVVEKSSACFNSVYDGEYVVGLTYEDGAIKLNQNGSTTTEVRYPEEGTSASAFGMAVVKGAPHEEAAKALVNFVCSAEGQSALAEYMEGTLRLTNANYKTPENAWLQASEEMKWVERPVEELTERKEELLAKWNELVGQHQ